MIKDIIFGLFGQFYKKTDSYKDEDDKGVFERFNEALGEEMDEGLLPLSIGLIPNVINPRTMFEEFLIAAEGDKGNDTLYLQGDVSWKRLVQQYVSRLWRIKGTWTFVKVALGWRGLTCNITEVFTAYSFDSPETFDDDLRKFDGGCPTCSTFTVDIARLDETTTPLGSTEIAAVLSILQTNTPINAEMTALTFNGSPIL